MKKIFWGISILFLSVFLSGCWISPKYDDYEEDEDNNSYYFKSYDDMKYVIIPLINSSFSDWHYGSKKFDSRYDEYFNNIDVNEDNYAYLQETDYNYAVKTGTASQKIYLKNGKNFSGRYYWITTKDGDALIFYKY